MCGIAGVLGRTRTDPLRIAAAARALRHRGPDDEGTFVDGGLGLAQTRLSIIGIATGRQPLFSADRRIALVANGEIYNHVELRAELERRGHRFATGSDCEVAVHAYREWNEAFLERLHGMFALALWDADRRRLLLARDRLGIKPLLARVASDRVSFSSELKGLIALEGERPAVNPESLARYLQCNYAPGSATLAAGVERVLPAQAWRIGPEGVEARWRYWHPEAIEPGSDPDPDAAIERLDELMDTVVDEHLRSEVPVGLFLSGGTDSGTLLGLMARRSAAPVHAYSVGFTEGDASDELADAARVAGRHGAVHTPVVLARDDLLARLPLAVWAADDLVADYANLPTLALAERASADLKVVFTGEGGDEVFAGYGRYRAQGPKGLRDRWLSPATDGYRARGNLPERWLVRILGPHARCAAASWRAPFEAAWTQAPSAWSALARRQGVDLHTWLPDDLLVKADRMLMAYGVEGRVPWLDHRVVELGLSLPDALKVCGRTGKVCLRRYAERHLPRDLCAARKRGFTVPVRAWLSGSWLDALEPALARNAGVREWLDGEGLAALFDRHRRSGRASAAIWAIAQFAIWHALFVQGDAGRPAAAEDPIAFLAG